MHSKYKDKISIPGFDGPLITLSLFKELQNNNLPEDIIQSAYEDYRNKYKNKKYESFYVEHQGDEWFKERYHPEVYLKWRNEKNGQDQKLCDAFGKWLQSEKNNPLISFQFNEEEANSKFVKYYTYGYNKDKNEFEEREIEKKNWDKNKESNISLSPLYAFDPDKLTLFIHQLPRNVSRWQVLDVVKKIPGFISLSLSEPIKLQNYNRYCWISFDTDDNLNMAYELLKDYKINSEYKMNPIKSKSLTNKKVRITPMLYPERIDDDLECTGEIIDMFDTDKEISNNPVLINKEKRSKEVQLDLQLLYLRKVHGFCYYCLEEFEDERNLSTKCENCHLRAGYLPRGRNEDIEMSEEREFDSYFTMRVKEFISKGIASNIETVVYILYYFH